MRRLPIGMLGRTGAENSIPISQAKTAALDQEPVNKQNRHKRPVLTELAIKNFKARCHKSDHNSVLAACLGLA
jgi:hypothetical protein